MRQAHRFSGEGMPYEGLTRMASTGPKWTGKIRLVHERLHDPLKWRKPRRVFVNSMSDLFHEDVPDIFLDQVFDIMERALRHTFQVLTKRPERMYDYVSTTLPISANVWLGVSAEDQGTWNERVPILLQTPAAVRWVSAEPLLGPINPANESSDLDWLVIGGESGPGARACNLRWVRGLNEWATQSRVPTFIKQLGRFPREDAYAYTFNDRKGGDMNEWPEYFRVRQYPAVDASCDG